MGHAVLRGGHAQARRLVGVEHVLFGSDWPHGEGLAEPDRLRQGAPRVLRRRDPAGDARQRLGLLGPPGRPCDRRPVAAPTSTTPTLLADVSALARRSTGIPTSPCASGGSSSAAAGGRAPHFPREWGGLRLLAGARSSRSRAAFQRPARCSRPAASGCSWPRPPSSATAPPEQIDRLVPPIYNGSVAWCQLFSEPGVGLRPRRPHHPRDARRRPLGDLGPEGLELHGHGGRLRHAPRAHRPRRRRSTRASRGSRSRSTSPGVTIRPLRRDHRARALQRGVLRRRGRRRRRPHRRARTTAGRSRRPRSCSSASGSAPAARWAASRRRARRAGSSTCAPATRRSAGRRRRRARC